MSAEKVLRRRRRTSAAAVEERGILTRALRVEHIVSHTHGKAEDPLAVNGNETHRCPTLSSKRSHRRTQRPCIRCDYELVSEALELVFMLALTEIRSSCTKAVYICGMFFLERGWVDSEVVDERTDRMQTL